MNLIHAVLWVFLSIGLGFLLLFVVVVFNDFLVDRDLRRWLIEEEKRQGKDDEPQR